MAGEIESLNASVAAGVLMYKIFEKKEKVAIPLERGSK